MKIQTWTVVRFPNGSWSYGGKPDSPDYELCEVWRIVAPDGKSAVKMAQRERQYRTRSAKREALAELRREERKLGLD